MCAIRIRTIRRRSYELLGLGSWFALVVVLHTFIATRLVTVYVPIHVLFDDVSASPYEFVGHLGQGLVAAYIAWITLVHLRWASAETGGGLVLAAFGVHCCLMSDGVLLCRALIGMTSLFDEECWSAPFAGEHALHAIQPLLHYGGIVAYVTGLALVTFGVWTDRAATPTA